MFNLHKKGGKNQQKPKSIQPVTEEGKMLSQPISPNIQGVLRGSLEKMAYVLEKELDTDQHIVTFIATADKKDKIQSMDIAFMRTSPEIFGEILMNVGMRDVDMGKTIIAVAHALQWQKKEYKDYSRDLKGTINEAIKSGEIKGGTGMLDKSDSFHKNNPGEIGGFNIENLAGASEEEVDNIIDNLLKETGIDKDEPED